MSNPNLIKYSEISDLKEKIRILERKLRENDVEIKRIELMKKKLMKENDSIEKQIKKYESIIAYAESLFDRLSIQYEEHVSVLKKRDKKK